MKSWPTLVFALSLCLVSGMADGLNQTLYAHYGAFKAKHPNAKDAYWNPAESWVAKYKDYPRDQRARFIGSKTVLVGLTDAYHITRQAYGLCIMLGVLFLAMSVPVLFARINSNMPYWAFVLVVIGGAWVAKSAGFHLVYTFIYNSSSI